MARLSDIDKEIIKLELEKSHLDREKSVLVLNKGLFLYFCFLFVAIMGFVNHYITKFMLNLMIAAGLVILIISTLPYFRIVRQAERNINTLIECLREKSSQNNGEKPKTKSRSSSSKKRKKRKKKR
ncbi:hypothetical protein ACFL0W_03425 [Nanoarchaeota archaeon]